MKTFRSAALVLATSAAVLVPAAAQAQTYVHQDAVGDVQTVDNNGNFVPAPDHQGGDITSSSVAHKPHAVVMSVQMKAVDASGAIGFEVVTNRHIGRVAVIEFYPHRAKAHLENRRGRNVRCHLTWSLDRIAGTARMDVPRRCLGQPRWVKAGMGTVGTPNDPSSPAFEFFLDDANNSKASLRNFPQLGPRLFR